MDLGDIIKKKKKKSFVKKPPESEEDREMMNRTRRIASLFSSLAIANNCASWLNLRLEIAVVRFPIDLIGFGVLAVSDGERE